MLIGLSGVLLPLLAVTITVLQSWRRLFFFWQPTRPSRQGIVDATREQSATSWTAAFTRVTRLRFPGTHCWNSAVLHCRKSIL